MKRIISLIFFIICILFTSQKTFADNIKFVQIADVHMSAESEYSQKVLKSAIEDINAQPEIAFVVFTGDNINNPTEENLKTFISLVKKLKVPYYIVLGNHDVYKNKKMSKVRYFEILRQGNPFYRQRSANYKFSKNGFIFLTADGAKEVIPGSVGYYRKDTLNWVNQILSKNEKSHVIIFQHFPVEYPEGVENKLKTHKTYKVEEYREMLAKHHNVLAVLSGHFHVNSETMKDGVYHISTPSIINMPNSYKIIDIITTKDFSPLIYTQLREFEVK